MNKIEFQLTSFLSFYSSVVSAAHCHQTITLGPQSDEIFTARHLFEIISVLFYALLMCLTLPGYSCYKFYVLGRVLCILLPLIVTKQSLLGLKVMKFSPLMRDYFIQYNETFFSPKNKLHASCIIIYASASALECPKTR